MQLYSWSMALTSLRLHNAKMSIVLQLRGLGGSNRSNKVRRIFCSMSPEKKNIPQESLTRQGPYSHKAHSTKSYSNDYA